MDDLEGLPDDVRGEIEGDDESRDEQLAAIGKALATKRTQAIDARKASGIEEVWMECEEAYVGIDNENRTEFKNAKWAKSSSLEGPLTREKSSSGEEVRSTLFLRMTSRYVDAGAAKLSEILLPIDDKAFSFSSTPVPDLVSIADDKFVERSNNPETAAAAQAEAKKRIEDAEDAAKKAEKRINDWLVECQARAHDSKSIFDQARIGVGVTKGPIPVSKRRRSVTTQEGMTTLAVVEEIKPVVQWVDPWKFYPDPACGENIHDGDHCFEYDFISPYRLRKLKKQPGFIASQIDKVLKEGPGKVFLEATNPNDIPDSKKHRFQIWYFTGALTRKDMEIAGADLEGVPEDAEDIYCIVTMVNDSVIRATVNPLDSGDLPYDAAPWQRRAGHWAGVGVGEQLRAPQRVLNGASRRMFDNAGKSAGSIIVVDRTQLIPADGSWTLVPDKLFYTAPNATMDDVRKAILTFQVPNVTKELMQIIDFAFKLAEESTSIPLITQGQTGKTTPETYGATQLQNSNANQLLRSIGTLRDDFVTEPRINRFYEWLLVDPDVPNNEKGDFSINARGSSSLVERAIQDETIERMGAIVENPIFGVNPKKWFEEYAKSKRLNPRIVQYTPQEQEEMDSQPPPAAPAVEAAKIRAESAERIAAGNQQVTAERIRVDTDRDTVYAQAENERARVESEGRREELIVRRELELLKYANQRQITLDQVKAQLAETAAKVQLQRDLAELSTSSDLHKHHNPQVMTPPAEPPGRADPGQAYQE